MCGMNDEGMMEVELPDAGVRKTIKMNDPHEPTPEERKEHEKTHLPYRSWCPHCVRGRGKEMPHRRGDQGGGLPELHFDYAFMGGQGDPGGTVPMLVVRSRRDHMTMATAVPRKSTGEFVTNRVIAFMKEIGLEAADVVVKSDQEPAVTSLIDEVGRKRAPLGGRWVVESSPVGSHASNGVVERAIQSVEGQVRVLKDALEARWKVKIKAADAVIPWLMEWSAYLLNRFEVGHDGKTAYERCAGKKAKSLGLEFGEAVLWRKKPVGGALGKLSVMWSDGVFLGIKGRTGECIIGDANGVWKTRTVQRKPETERWRSGNSQLVKFVPWKVSNDDEKADGETYDVIRPADGFAPGDVFARPEATAPRRAKILKSDLVEHGYTAGCEGCRAVLTGKPPRAHSQKCRERLEELMKDETRVKDAKQRGDEFLSKILEDEDRKRMKLQDEKEKEKEKKVEVQEGKPEMVKEKDVEMKMTGQASGSGYSEKERKEQVEGDLRLGMDISKEATGSRAMDHQNDEGSPKKMMKVDDRRSEKRKTEGGGDEDRGDDDPEEMGDTNALEIDEEEDPVNEWDWDESYVDQKTGDGIDPVLARAARDEEVKFMKTIELYDEVSIEECWAETVRPPVSTKWVDLNKGTRTDPDIRCRLVARDFKPKGEKDRVDLFAATPPLEAKKFLFMHAVQENARRRRTGRPRIKIMMIDVKKAHLNGFLKPGERAYIELPGEAGKRGMCGRLRRWLYGMRPAAGAWEDDYSDKLVAMGFVKGEAVPTAFFRPRDEVRCVVHGDDFTFSGEADSLKEVAKEMKEVYELKVRAILGDEPGDDRAVTILNRRIEWAEEGIRYEADPRHVEELTKFFGLKEDSNGLDVPIVKEEVTEEEEPGEPLEGEELRNFRGLAARANYLAADRVDIQYAAKEICRDMARPTTKSMAKLKRLARYLTRYPRGIIMFKENENERGIIIDVFTDSDWAGCRGTRKSTSGGVMMYSGGMLKSWSSTQATVALSSGEAEYYAVVKAAAEALGMIALLKDLGLIGQARLWVDSAAAKSIVSRVGLGKLRHLEVKYLWVQQVVKKKRLSIYKIKGTLNPGDWLTKPGSTAKRQPHFQTFNFMLV